MSKPYLHIPGVPAGGHISRGYWHPGGIDGCRKCPQPASKTDRPDVGDSVRILRDAIPGLAGQVGTLAQFGPDGTTAWVTLPNMVGVWCSVSALEKEGR